MKRKYKTKLKKCVIPDSNCFLADSIYSWKRNSCLPLDKKILEDVWLPNENQILGLYGEPKTQTNSRKKEIGGGPSFLILNSTLSYPVSFSAKPFPGLLCLASWSLVLHLTFYSDWTLERQGHLCWAIQRPFLSLTLWVSLLFERPQWRGSFWTPGPLDSNKSLVLFLPFELDNRKADIQCGAM